MITDTIPVQKFKRSWNSLLSSHSNKKMKSEATFRCFSRIDEARRWRKDDWCELFRNFSWDVLDWRFIIVPFICSYSFLSLAGGLVQVEDVVSSCFRTHFTFLFYRYIQHKRGEAKQPFCALLRWSMSMKERHLVWTVDGFAKIFVSLFLHAQKSHAGWLSSLDYS